MAIDLLHTAGGGIGGLAITENDIIAHSTDLFQGPKKELAMVHCRELTVRPNELTHAGPWNFEIPAQGADWFVPGHD